MRRLICVTALTVGLCLAGTTTAQPRPGGPDRGRGDGPDVKKLEAELEKLSAQLKDLDARLSKMQQANAPKDGPRGDRSTTGPGPGGRQAGGRGGDDRPGPGFGGGRGFGPEGGRAFDRFAPGGPRGPGGGPGARGPGGRRGPGTGGPPDIGRRLDRIIDELERLKKDLEAPRR
jgi:translation initiation factor IF-2